MVNREEADVKRLNGVVDFIQSNACKSADSSSIGPRLIPS